MVGPIQWVLQSSTTTAAAQRAGLSRSTVLRVLDPAGQAPFLPLLRLARLAQVELFGLMQRDFVSHGAPLAADECELLDHFRAMTADERRCLLASAEGRE